MKEKFNDLTVETDTVILMRVPITVGKTDAVYEKWQWDGIYGESIIFYNEDIPKLKERDLKNKILNQTAIVQTGSQFTFTKREKYTFVNCNFKVMDDA